MLSFCIPVHAFTFTADFESCTLGTEASGTSGFDNAGTETLCSDIEANSGTQSALFNWLVTNGTGFATTTGVVGVPETVTEGNDVWARGYFYFPVGWDWTCDPVIKILRVHVVDAVGSNVGHVSVFGHSTGIIRYSNEVSGPIFNTSTLFDIGAWQTIEIYVHTSTTSPIVRIWKNGVLIYEATTDATLSATDDYVENVFFMSYWNGGVTVDQQQYIDDVQITNNQPNNQDAAGNYMIGPSDWNSTPARVVVTGKFSGRIQ